MALLETSKLPGGCEPIPLSQLRVGDRGRFLAAEMTHQDRDLLQALGISERCDLRVCQAGDPYIVQIRATRIGISDRLAEKILIVPTRS